MPRRLDIDVRDVKIFVEKYVMYLDLRLHVDQFKDGQVVSIEKMEVTRIYDTERKKDVDKIYRE